ncbi:hypothetical protein CV742_23390 [Vibrio parahaemolyticus]|nr:hypothetical protein [Vibrio parahaemolyticus]
MYSPTQSVGDAFYSLKAGLLRLRIGKLRQNVPNKQFKRDSARVALLVCVGFCVEVQCGGLVTACFTP